MLKWNRMIGISLLAMVSVGSAFAGSKDCHGCEDSRRDSGKCCSGAGCGGESQSDSDGRGQCDRTAGRAGDEGSAGAERGQRDSECRSRSGVSVAGGGAGAQGSGERGGFDGGESIDIEHPRLIVTKVPAPRPLQTAASCECEYRRQQPRRWLMRRRRQAAGPAVVAAIAPLRVLPVDPPVKDGLKAAFTMGPVKMTPYGFLKATGVYDTSNPNGDDMPFPGLFLATPQVFSTGPTKDPEFHLKARSSRIGANFEFADLSPKITMTGRIEGDFEGNFSEVDNRDVSSIRSSMFSFRQAWARLDYAASDKTDIYFEGGQDWTLFGSSALPNLLETTALGYWYGDVYERSPQFQFGLVQKLGGSRNVKFSPTFAIMMPSSSQIEKLGSLGLQGQIAQAEREGADSGRPELEGRVALQFQLDKAPAVAPAQIIVSGVEGRRTSVVPNSSYCTSVLRAAQDLTPANYVAAFPSGFTASSNIYGLQGAVQLPTRWFTLVASAYRGGDLRFFFAGQVNSFATDTSGLSNIVGGANSGFTGYNAGFATLDGGPLVAAGGAVLGCNVNVATRRSLPDEAMW